MAADEILSATDRLAASRSRLRSAMMEIVHPPKSVPLFGAKAGNVMDDLLARVRGIPGASLLADIVSGWWQQHPLHTAGVVAGQASRAFVKPIALRNPQSLIIGAAIVGALFAVTRPWRWLLRPALFIGLLPQLVSQVAKRVPIASLMRLAASMLLTRKVARRAKQRPPAPSAPPRDSDP